MVETITNSQYVWLTLLIKILHGREIIMHHAKEGARLPLVLFY